MSTSCLKHPPTLHVILIVLSWSADLGVKRCLVPVEQLLHTLANLRGDVTGCKRRYVFPHTPLSQKATERGVR